jgi:hypothetical protein
MQDMQLTPPVAVDTSALTLPPLLKVAADSLRKMDMGFNIDVMTPATFNTAMADGFQAVMLGIKTPDQQLADMDKAFREGKK